MIPKIVTSHHFQEVCQGALLTFLALYNGAAAVVGVITETDWNRMTGPHGVAFIAVIAVIGLWVDRKVEKRGEQKRRDKEDEAKEKRNQDLIDALKQLTESNHGLTERAITTIAESKAAIITLDRNIQRLTIEVSDKIPNRRAS